MYKMSIFLFHHCETRKANSQAYTETKVTRTQFNGLAMRSNATSDMVALYVVSYFKPSRNRERGRSSRQPSLKLKNPDTVMDSLRLKVFISGLCLLYKVG